MVAVDANPISHDDAEFSRVANYMLLELDELTTQVE